MGGPPLAPLRARERLQETQELSLAEPLSPDPLHERWPYVPSEQHSLPATPPL